MLHLTSRLPGRDLRKYNEALMMRIPMLILRPQSATTAWQQAFFGLQWRRGDRILTSVQEYATNYINFLQVGLLSESQSLKVPESQSIDRPTAGTCRISKVCGRR